MSIRAIDVDDLKEGDLITWYGVHVLRWEDEIRPYGIEPTIAFVQDDAQEDLVAELLEALKEIYEQYENRNWIDWGIVEQAIAKAEGKDG